jgi:predicted tellurium resistance membrane protein TerC
MDVFLTSEGLLALVTLTVLEIVLGIDNVVFISILSGKLPVSKQARAMRVGLLAAMGMRILLLFLIAWIIRLTAPLVTVLGQELSGRDLILISGGLFLLGKATLEIHDSLEGEDHRGIVRGAPSFAVVIGQVMLLDIVFSLDSVITAVGMVEDLAIMVTAVVIAIGVMMVSANGISAFVQRHPTVKVLALSFLLLIGLSLVGEGLEFHIPKGYIYFAMGFSVFVEMINQRVRRSGVPVRLRERYRPLGPLSGRGVAE